MKFFYSLLALITLTGTVRAQIQQLNFATANKESIKINRISPAASKQPNKISLDGTWQFSTDINHKPASEPIAVPGEWVMQGFDVKKNALTGYQKNFTLPDTWKNKRVKLRFDAVYSEAEIWINGKKAASHLGGFTPFEVDVNAFVKWNDNNTLLVKVRSETMADSLSSASQYAVHNLGGISRKVYLMALAPVNFAYADAKTLFDDKYENATLSTDVIVANEHTEKINNGIIKAELFKADGTTKVGEKTVSFEKELAKGEFMQQNISFNVQSPLKWDPEHPNLYVLKLSILHGNSLADVITKNIGFRQVEVRKNQVFVNNKPIKLRGVCRHEVMPLRGRSLDNNMWEKDVKLFIAGNVNYIRTSHYPPAEELIDACNRLGMFLEVEAPFCWAHRTPLTLGTEMAHTLLVDQTMDMITYFRSNPSVIIWSLGNESLKYKEYFKATGKLVKQFDPTRLRNFSEWGPEADEGDLEITNHHYPGPVGPGKYKDYKRPVVFDEYVHLNAYNRRELVTDPGVRDAWGIGFASMWENMYQTNAVLGGAIWAGIDDTFFLPNGKTVGYGTWGPIDGWRREKPEFWHMRKAYSPVKIQLASNWNNGRVTVILENRLLFSNLNECKIEWQAAGEKGFITANLTRNNKTTATINMRNKPNPGEKMVIKVYDPRGIWVDSYQFVVAPIVEQLATTKKQPAHVWKYLQNENILTATAGGISIKTDLTSGEVQQVTKNGKPVWSSSAKLMVLPLTGEGNGVQMVGDTNKIVPFNEVAKNRIVSAIKLHKDKNSFYFSVKDSYNEAAGTINYRFFSNGAVDIDYQYILKEDINPRQWGLVFSLPQSFQELSWNRNGMWDDYPADHIGRTSGIAQLITATKISGPAGPSAMPSTPWRLDRNELGSNDFRSTKMNINHAKLSNGTHSFAITSNGLQHIRAWQNGKQINALVAGYSNMGTEQFFRDHAAKMDKPLKTGDTISDTIHLQF